MSILFYDSAGSDAPEILADGTHSTAYGGYELAKCIVTGIRQNKLSLADSIVNDFQDFDPAHPDSAGQLDLEKLFSQNEKRVSEGRRSASGLVPNMAPAVTPSAGKPGAGPL